MTKKLPKRGLPPMHPGELLHEEILPALDRSKAEIARLLGVSRQTLYEVLKEKQPVTPTMALRLGSCAETVPISGSICKSGTIWIRPRGSLEKRSRASRRWRPPDWLAPLLRVLPGPLAESQGLRPPHLDHHDGAGGDTDEGKHDGEGDFHGVCINDLRVICLPYHYGVITFPCIDVRR